MKRIKCFPLLICFSVFFLGIGYAAINSITMNIEGNAQAIALQDVVITKVEYNNDNNADLVNSELINYLQTVMQSKVVLSDTDGTSSITYDVKIFNGTDETVVFTGINQDPEYYDNNEITYELFNIDQTTVIESKQDITFQIKFKYVNDTVGSSNILNSYIGFNFANIYTIKYFGFDDTNLPSTINTGENLQVNLPISLDRLKVSINDNIIEIDGVNYIYENNVLTLNNVTGNVIICDYQDPTITISSDDYLIVDDSITLNVNIVNNNNYVMKYTINPKSSNVSFVGIEKTLAELETSNYNITLSMNNYNTATLQFLTNIPIKLEYIKSVDFANIANEYELLEYIESSGVEYIDTNITPNQDTGFQIKYLSKNKVASIGYGSIMGGRLDAKEDELQLTTYAVGGSLRYGTANYKAGIVTNTIQEASLINGVYTNPNGEITVLTPTTFTSPCTMTVFTLNENGNKKQYGTLRVYYLKIYDGDVLIRDYIPVIEKSSGKLGLYDKIYNEFYDNKGSGEFYAGELYNITYDLNSGVFSTTGKTFYNKYEEVTLINPSKQGWTFAGWSGPDLVGNNNMTVTIPKGSTGDRHYTAHYVSDNIVTYGTDGITNFTLLTYIESTGVQYIDTNFIPDENSGYDIKYLSKDGITTSKYGTIFGTRTASNVSMFSLTTYSGGQIGFGTKRYASGITTTNELQEVSLRNRVYTNNAGVTTSMTNYGEINPNANLVLFGINTYETSVVTQLPKVQIYYFRLYDGDVMVRDYVPVKRNSDSKIGIYDRVENKFYTDFTGNDNFLYAE